MGFKKYFERKMREEIEDIPKKKLSPDEVELMILKEERRRDAIRVELDKERKRKNRELIIGSTFDNRKHFLNSKNVFKNKARIL